MADVFISYSRRDKDFVARLHEALVARGKDPWVDWEDIPASADWYREIQDGIDGTDAFVLVLSPDSASSQVCSRELEHALARNKRILPVVRRDVDPASLPPQVAAVNWIHLREQDAFEPAVDTLVAAIDTDLEHVRTHTRLGQAAVEWDRSQRNGSLLVRGTELEQAERWLTAAAGKQPPPTELQSEFVQASREALRRRQRLQLASVVAALAVAVVLSVVALVQRSNAVRQSKAATARELLAQAQNQYDVDPELSVLLAEQAMRTDPGEATTEGLRRALVRSHVVHALRFEGGPVADALWDPDGERLLVSRPDGKVEVAKPGAAAKALEVEQRAVYSSLSWDADGEVFVAGGGEPRAFDSRTGEMLADGGSNGAQRIAVDREGERMFWADLDGTVHSLDILTADGEVRYEGDTGRYVSCLDLSPDGRLLVAASSTDVASDDATERLEIWDARSGRRLREVALPASPSSCAFDPDGRRFAVAMPGGERNGVLMFDARSGRRLRAFADPATAVTFSPDGSRIAYSQSGIPVAYIQDLERDQPILLIGHSGGIQSLEFSPTGAFIGTSSFDGTARIWNGFDGSHLRTLSGHDGTVRKIHFSPDETRVATAGEDGTVRIWETTVTAPDRTEPVRGSGVAGAGFTRDGRRILVNERSVARMIDARDLSELAAFEPPPGMIHIGAAQSHRGDLVATISGKLDKSGNVASTGSAHVYDSASGRQLAELDAGAPTVNGDFAGRSGRIVTITAGGLVIEWEARSGRRLWSLELDQPPGGVAYAPDGELLAVAHPGESEEEPITVDLLRDGKVVRRIEGPPHESQIVTQGLFVQAGVAFSPDGSELTITGAGPYAYRYDTTTGKRLGRLPTKESFSTSATYSHDGELLAAQNTNSAQLFSLAAGDLLRQFQHVSTSAYRFNAGEAGTVYAGFSRDDSVLLTSGNGRVRAWWTQTGESLLDVPGAYGALSPDGEEVVALGAERVELYRCRLCTGAQGLLLEARKATTREFTRTERRLYLRGTG